MADPEQVRVSIGIPVRNGGGTLRRALDSVLGQSHAELEIVISDNASTDDTEAIGRDYARRDPRVRYHRQPVDRGAVANFAAVLAATSSELFMWLAHDDWIDRTYVARCRAILDRDPGVAIAGGRARYYSDGQPSYDGTPVNLLDASPHRRVVAYFARLHDNAIVYGLVRRTLLERVTLAPGMAPDWVVVAGLAYQGKVVTADDVVLHRSAAGASRVAKGMVAALRLPAWQGALQLVMPSVDLFRDIAWAGASYAGEIAPRRVLLASAAATLALRPRVMRALGRREGLAGRLFPKWREEHLAAERAAIRED